MRSISISLASTLALAAFALPAPAPAHAQPDLAATAGAVDAIAFDAAGAAARRRPDGARLLDESFAEGFVDGDVDALVALYAPDGVLYNITGEPAVGHAQIRAALEGFLGVFDVIEFRHVSPRYETTGNLSVGWARFEITVVPSWGGPAFVIGGRSTTVAKLVHGDWYYVHDHASLPQPE